VQDVVVGVLAVVVGALFCFRGYVAMRIIIPMWGAFGGFMLGAGFVDAASDDGFLRTVLGWIVGIAVAFVFALIAYLYYEVSVVLAMAAVGFALGTSAMVALGVSWSWLIVLVGVVAGAALAVVAIVADLPVFLLTLLTALAGASTAVFGLMLLFGVIDTADLDSAITTERLDDDWWWYAVYAAVAIAGIVVQVRYTERLRTTLREQWIADGGREMRTS
jgi:hypothetical protein